MKIPMGEIGQPNSARLRVSTDGSGMGFQPMNEEHRQDADATLRGRRPLGVIDHIVDRGREFLNARARDDDGVAAAVRFLGDAEEFAAVIFAEFHVKALAFDLNVPGLYEVIHLFGKNGGV
jgi:hypothetical protein